jgi:hypothetical protein
MKNIYYFLSILLAFTFLNCGGGSKNLTKVDTGDIPDWYLTPPQDPAILFGVNSSTSQDMQLAVDKSMTGARAEIARQLEVKLSDMQKKFAEEVGTDANATMLAQFTQATKTVTSQTLTGSNVKSKKIFKDGNLWRAYVLVQYPVGAGNQALMDQIKKNNELYTRFRSTQTFDELDKEVQKYQDSNKSK